MHWYPYYAGYSSAFVHSVLAARSPRATGVVLDPWNGSGTTTEAATHRGWKAIGFDVNPAMVVVAKARQLSPRVRGSVSALANAITAHAETLELAPLSEEPLTQWMQPSAAAYVRQLEASVQHHLVEANVYRTLARHQDAAGLSDLAAFFYVALFRTLRVMVAKFAASNPTWIKIPKNARSRVRPTRFSLADRFLREIRVMMDNFELTESCAIDSNPRSTLGVASSTQIPLPDSAADIVVTSPPYCTRIDYAVTSRLELSLLGMTQHDVDSLRRSMIGTSTVSAEAGDTSASWGSTCIRFLNEVYHHPSKASASYYWKTHCQYFSGLFASLQEIARILVQRGEAVIVVQDSFYKEVHNDLPAIVAEMATGLGLRLRDKQDFVQRRTLASVHPWARRYRNTFVATESVLALQKQ